MALRPLLYCLGLAISGTKLGNVTKSNLMRVAMPHTHCGTSTNTHTHTDAENKRKLKAKVAPSSGQQRHIKRFVNLLLTVLALFVVVGMIDAASTLINTHTYIQT